MAGFVFLDPFVDVDGTALASHTPNLIGTSWTEEVKTGAQNWQTDGTSRVETSGNEESDRILNTADDAPATAEYHIVVRLDTMDSTGDETFFVVARFTDTSNFYLCTFFPADDAADKRLHKNVAATITEIATGDVGGAGVDKRVVFEVTNARKAMFYDTAQGTPTISSTDDALTSIGLAGMAMGNFINSTDDLGILWRIADFAVIDIEDLECFDDFMEDGDVLLDSHTADTGEAWTLEEASSADRVHTDEDNSGLEADSEASDHVYYSIGRVLTDAEYKIEVVFNELATATGTDDPVFILARFADTSNFYFGGTYTAGAAADKKIYKEVSTTVTEIATGDAGGIVDSYMTFEILDATKKIFFNGAEIISTTDDVITAKGEVGLGWGNLAISTNDMSSTLDIGLFVVSNIGGVAAPSGTGALIFGPIVISGTGTMQPDGTGALALPAPSINGTGVMQPSGSGALLLGVPAIAGSGVQKFEGSGALLIAVPSIAGTGVEVFTATGALALNTVAIAGTGVEEFIGSGALLLAVPAIVGTGSAGTSPDGAGALLLGVPSIVGTGRMEPSGVGALALGPPLIAGSAVEEFIASGALALAVPTIDGTGSHTEGASGSGALVIPGLAINGTGVEIFTATAALLLGKPAISGSAIEEFTATGGLTIAKPIISGSGLEEFIGTGALTIPGLAIAGTAIEELIGQGALLLSAPAINGVAAINPSGTGALRIAGIIISGTGVIEVLLWVPVDPAAAICTPRAAAGGVWAAKAKAGAAWSAKTKASSIWAPGTPASTPWTEE